MITTKIKGKEVLLDSNVIIYSTNKLSAKHKQAVEFRDLAKEEFFKPIISHQNILESLRILTHSKYENSMSLSEGLMQVNSFRQLCEVIHPFSETDEIVLSLIKKYELKSNQIFDAYLVATMLSNSIWFIATDNLRDMKVFKEVEVFNPFVD